MNPFSNIIPLFIVIPLSAAFIVSLAGRKVKRLADIMGLLATLSLSFWSVVALWVVNEYGTLIYNVGAWKPPIGIVMVLDGLSAFMLVTVNFVVLMIFIFSTEYMEQYTSKWKFYTLFLLMLGGMNGVLITGDIFNLFVFLEIAAIASFSLVAFGVERHQFEAAFKYAVMSTLGSLFILLGIALLYGYTSTLNMADIARVLAAKGLSNVIILVSLLFIMGFGLKAALVPFHAWLPDAHPSAPAPISAMLSGVLIKSLGVYTLCRIFFNVIGLNPVVASIFLMLGAISMVLGGLSAVGQTDMKRLLAYSSVSQMGYIFLGFGLGTPLGVFGALFHLFNHSIFKSLLFLNSGAVEYATGTRDMEKLGGLMKKMPVTGVTTLIGSMSIAGIPPLSGFWSKLIIIIACVMAGKFWYAFWAVAASFLTLAAIMKVMKNVFWGEPGEALKNIKEVPNLMKYPMVGLSVICLIGGLILLPWPRNFFLNQARDAVLKGQGYSEVVLKDIH